jgi:DNA-binding MarR family transcriptional regulator
VGATREYRPQTGYTSWLLKRAERRAAASLYDSLRELGLTPSQYGVLGALSRLERASSADLARTQFVTPQAMTRLVTGLERLGYIRRKPHQTPRIVEATLTPSGRRVFEEATRRVVAIDAEMTGSLSADEAEQLRRLLTRCVDAFTPGA